MTEFEFERGAILENLVLLEDHARSFPCPFCMEKHASKIAGYADEIAGGGEDVKDMQELAEKAREWRRFVQGAKEHSHTDSNPVKTECSFRKEQIHPKRYFHKGSFRTLCPECPEQRCSLCPPNLTCATRIVVGCKKGRFKKGTCQIGMEPHNVFHSQPK